MRNLAQEIVTCRLCADRFAATKTAHAPRPVVWFQDTARILVAGQAPGLKVHNSGRPFTDASGDRLRDWMGIDVDTFYDRERIAIVPMAFCFPGYDDKGADLPPPKVCAETWHRDVVASLTKLRLTVLVGGYAHRWYLGTRGPVSETVAGFADHAPSVIPLPHPSWRNTAWLRKNPWFETDVVPALRHAVREALE